MDVPGLLVQARHRAGLSQVALARAAGTARSTLRLYEAGQRSPTTDVLDRLLAACGLQVPHALEPLMADLDARLEAMLAGPPEIDVERLTKVAAGLDDLPTAPVLSRTKPLYREGPVSWALDRETGLALHGLNGQVLGGEQLGTCLALVFDDAARWWLRSVAARGSWPNGSAFNEWLDVAVEDVRACTAYPVTTICGVLHLRLVEDVSRAVQLQPAGSDRTFPVLALDELERAHPASLAPLLARWRSRPSQT